MPSDAIGVESLHERGFPIQFSGPVSLHANHQLANAPNQLAVRYRFSEPPQPRVSQARRVSSVPSLLSAWTDDIILKQANIRSGTGWM